MLIQYSPDTPALQPTPPLLPDEESIINAMLASASEEEVADIEKAVQIMLARQNFLAYAQLVDPGFLAPPHITVIADVIEATDRGELRKVILMMAPRHGKSQTVSGTAPGWLVGRNPKRRFILTTHTAALAESFSIQNRDVIDTNPYYPLVFPGVVLSSTVRAADRWAVNKERETLIAAGVGGTITGYGAHYLIIDDAHKNYEEAVSEAHQTRVYNWYKTTARTRAQKGCVVFIVMTHWHENDLIGRILNSEEANEFKVVALPAESLGTRADVSPEEQATLTDYQRTYVFPDILGRPKGTPLWPEMGFDKAFLSGTKRLLRSQYSGLYQCSPSGEEGEKFKRADFRSVTALLLEAEGYKLVHRCRSWDLAFSKNEEADATVGLRAALYAIPTHRWTQDHIDRNVAPFLVVLEDEARWREEWDTGKNMLIETAIKDGRDVDIYVEAVASQNTAFKSLRQNPRMAGFNIVPVTVGSDKIARSKYAIGLSGTGVMRILYPNASTSPTWESALLDEISTFPNAIHDDRVDALTQACKFWQPIIDSYILELASASDAILNPKPQRNLPFELSDTRQVGPARDGFAWAN
jgi:phage terminase large subunit-like protein